jgi:hypothetical protein
VDTSALMLLPAWSMSSRPELQVEFRVEVLAEVVHVGVVQRREIVLVPAARTPPGPGSEERDLRPLAVLEAALVDLALLDLELHGQHGRNIHLDGLQFVGVAVYRLGLISDSILFLHVLL